MLFRDADGVIDGAIKGLGVARIMSYQASVGVSEGRLVPILESDSPAPIPVHLVHSAQALQPLKLRAFMDFMIPRIERVLTRIDQVFDRSRAKGRVE